MQIMIPLNFHSNSESNQTFDLDHDQRLDQVAEQCANFDQSGDTGPINRFQ